MFQYFPNKISVTDRLISLKCVQCVFRQLDNSFQKHFTWSHS